MQLRVRVAAPPCHARPPGPRADPHQRPLLRSSCSSSLVQAAAVSRGRRCPLGRRWNCPPPLLGNASQPDTGLPRVLLQHCPCVGPADRNPPPCTALPSCPRTGESRSLGVGIWDCQDTRTGQQRTRREERECLHAGLRSTSSLWEKLKQHLREKGAWQSEGSGKARRPSDDTNGSPLETGGCAQGWGARRRLSEAGTRHAAGRGRARGLRAGPRPRPLPGACRWRLRKGS